MNGKIEQGIERFGGVLEGRPRPTLGCSAIEEEEEEEEGIANVLTFITIIVVPFEVATCRVYATTGTNCF
jgi:hypothetical protein